MWLSEDRVYLLSRTESGDLHLPWLEDGEKTHVSGCVPCYVLIILACGEILCTSKHLHALHLQMFDSGYTVVQLVEALRYKPEGRGFDSVWYHWNFSLT
jgi:hypothetical protein